eukprot:TRINITY_DN26085_c0_g1_i1.p1 TRINITY_DN26085_c0_g1~~TRINITY_DN26085_c0_g1_i1.p1  ORF type:complete len:215 (+),score=-16.29 TRINITY_DN26085_c0_g1_i1:100-744(+)
MLSPRIAVVSLVFQTCELLLLVKFISLAGQLGSTSFNILMQYKQTYRFFEIYDLLYSQSSFDHTQFMYQEESQSVQQAKLSYSLQVLKCVISALCARFFRLILIYEIIPKCRSCIVLYSRPRQLVSLVQEERSWEGQNNLMFAIIYYKQQKILHTKSKKQSGDTFKFFCLKAKVKDQIQKQKRCNLISDSEVVKRSILLRLCSNEMGAYSLNAL